MCLFFTYLIPIIIYYLNIRVNTYAELYGNIKKEPIKNGSGNKLIASTLATENSVFGIVNELNKEGDFMNGLNNIHKEHLANQNEFEHVSRFSAELVDNSVFGIFNLFYAPFNSNVKRVLGEFKENLRS